LGFKSLTADAGQTKQERVQNVQDKIDYWKKYNFVTVTTTQQLSDLCEHLKTNCAFALDTETTGLQALEVELVGISVCADEQSASLKNLSHYFFHEEMLTYDEVVKANKYQDFSYVPIDMASLYSCADSYQTLRLVNVIHDAFNQEPKVATLYTAIEHPLIQIL